MKAPLSKVTLLIYPCLRKTSKWSCNKNHKSLTKQRMNLQALNGGTSKSIDKARSSKWRSLTNMNLQSRLRLVCLDFAKSRRLVRSSRKKASCERRTATMQTPFKPTLGLLSRGGPISRRSRRFPCKKLEPTLCLRCVNFIQTLLCILR